MKKYYISGIIIIVIIAGGTYYFQDKYLNTVNQEVKSGIVYHNEKYGLDFKYPATWPKPIEKDLGTKISLQFEHSFFVEYGTYITESTGEVSTFEKVISSPNKVIKMDDKEVIRVEDSKYGIPVHIAYIKGNNNKILSIEDSGGLISAEDFDNVISSFNFTFK